MKFVSKKNGVYANVDYWDGEHLNKIKKDLDGFPDYNYIVMDNHNLKIVEDDIVDMSRKIDVVVPKDKYVVRYLTGNLPFRTCNQSFIKKNFEKSNVQGYKEIVSNKTGKHYDYLKWNGHWSNLPEDFYGLEEKRYRSSIDDNGTFHLVDTEFQKKSNSKCISKEITTVPNPGYILVNIDDDIDLGVTGLSVAQFEKNYHHPKITKLPKQLFAVCAESGEYSDSESKVVAIRSTATEAHHVANHLQKEYGSDYDLNSDTDYIVYQVPT